MTDLETDVPVEQLDDSVLPPSLTPGALQEYKTREVPGGLIEFEYAPYGWLRDNGEPRLRDHRAYFWTPFAPCEPCAGTGRRPSEKRPGNTIKCQPCGGTGQTGRQRMVSVTTLLDAICPKPGIPPWAEARGIEGAFTAMQRGLVDPLAQPEDVVEIVRHHHLGADRARDEKADRGLNIHALLERYMLTGTVANPSDLLPEHQGFFRALVKWLLKYDPEPVAVEQLVCDPQAGYAGRRDLVAMVGGRRVGFDAKTSDKAAIYAGAHVQLALYERAAVKCGDEPCDALEVVVFAADGEYRPMVCAALPERVEVALAFYEWMKPIESVCQSMNRFEKESRA